MNDELDALDKAELDKLAEHISNCSLCIPLERASRRRGIKFKICDNAQKIRKDFDPMYTLISNDPEVLLWDETFTLADENISERKMESVFDILGR